MKAQLIEKTYEATERGRIQVRREYVFISEQQGL